MALRRGFTNPPPAPHPPAHCRKDYAWQHAFTGETLNNIWDINHFMAQRLSEVWKEVVGEGAATMVADADKGVWAL